MVVSWQQNGFFVNIKNREVSHSGRVHLSWKQAAERLVGPNPTTSATTINISNVLEAFFVCYSLDLVF